MTQLSRWIVTPTGAAGTWMVRPLSEPIPPGQTAQNAGVAVYKYRVGSWRCQKDGWAPYPPGRCQHIQAVLDWMERAMSGWRENRSGDDMPDDPEAYENERAEKMP